MLFAARLLLEHPTSQHPTASRLAPACPCPQCDDGWQPKDENICERCTAIEHCKSYDSTCACATCDAGYSGPACQPEAAGQCATEPPGCAEAEAGNCERCAVCANTHQLDWYAGTCSQCPENPRCETLYQNTCGCAKCRDGYVGWMCEAVSAAKIALYKIWLGWALTNLPVQSAAGHCL